MVTTPNNTINHKGKGLLKQTTKIYKAYAFDNIRIKISFNEDTMGQIDEMTEWEQVFTMSKINKKLTFTRVTGTAASQQEKETATLIEKWARSVRK